MFEKHKKKIIFLSKAIGLGYQVSILLIKILLGVVWPKLMKPFTNILKTAITIFMLSSYLKNAHSHRNSCCN